MATKLIKAVLATSSVLVVKAQQSLLPFESFLELHGRSYQQGTTEYEERRSLYASRLATAEAHNSLSDRLYNKGVNKLWDWTATELKTLRGWDGSMQPEGGGSTMRSARGHSFLQEILPNEKIWDNLAMAHNVKDQQNCGSCWAIASASTLEGHIQIYTGKSRTVSAQQIVECTPNPRHCGGDGGCKGATSELAMEYVLKNGVAEESNFPYTGVDGICKTDAAKLFLDHSHQNGGAGLGMTGWETLPKNQYAPLVMALAQLGPVAVSVAADDWFDYDSGVFNGCGKDAIIDHAVVALGYGGTKAGTKYWVIQNSWGADWGEKGHIRIRRHAEGEYCGMNTDPQKGVACQGETKAVPVCGMCGILFDSVVPHFK